MANMNSGFYNAIMKNHKDVKKAMSHIYGAEWADKNIPEPVFLYVGSDPVVQRSFMPFENDGIVEQYNLSTCKVRCKGTTEKSFGQWVEWAGF